MRHTLYTFLILTVSLFASCDALDLSSEDGFTEGGFWKNESQVAGYITGMHAELRGQAQTFYIMGEQRGGLLTTKGTFGTGMDNISLIDHDLRETSPGYSNWAGFYSKILNLNILIDRLEGGLSFLSQDKLNYYLGQAYGMRAWYYFYLLRTWGGVPLITEPKVTQGATNPTDLYTPRSSEADIVNFLKEEITRSENSFANDNFTLNSTRDLWSKGATLMLKAEIYLWAAKVYGTDAANDLTTAMNALKAVQASGKFKLLDNFGDVFSYGNKGNAEIIFALHYEKGEAEQNMKRFMYDIPQMANYYDRNGEPIGDPLNVGDQTILATEWKWEFYESFSDKDTRKDFTFLDFYSKDRTKHGVVLRKFLGTVDANTNKRSYSDDMPIYRYADVLLLMAEIKNKQGQDPSIEINEIRKRAYGEGNYEVYTNKTFAENELAILRERDKEFVREGKRWFDVRRMQDASGKPLAFTQSGLKESEAYKLLWPIDTGTMTKDPTVKQTPGYDEAAKKQ